MSYKILDERDIDLKYSSNSEKAQSGKAVAEAVAKMVDSAPETLNTLNELAAALGNDPNFATTVATQIGQKANKTEVPANVSQLNNDAGYITADDIPEIGESITVDDTLSDTSTNPVQNKVITAQLQSLLNIDYNELAFDTTEIVVNSINATSVLGQAILGQMVLA